MRLQFFLFILLGSLHWQGLAQNLFLADCFEGGVTAAGRTSTGAIDNGTFEIHWEPEYDLHAAYLLTYRYWRPDPKQVTINGTVLNWDYNSQVGNEQLEDEVTGYFAVHAIDITDQVQINDQTVSATMFGSDGATGEPNRGWWSLMMVVLYDAPNIQDTTCFRIYTASQSQTGPQMYSFDSPEFQSGSDLGLSIYADRLSVFESDQTCIEINDQNIGCIWTPDNTNPLELVGVRGHFYFQNGQLTGLDDDIPNESIYQSDGIAVINNYLTDTDIQNISLARPTYDDVSFNPHPAFFIAYKPDCATIDTDEIPRTYTRCRGDTIQPAFSGYDHYAWSPATGLSDTAVGNPLCYADTSRWYSVKMWSDDEDICPQTIPVFVDVKNKPEPSISVQPSTCPEATGSFVIFHEDASAYVVNGTTTQVQQHTGLPAGTQEVAVIGNNGCTWEGTVEIPLVAPAEASFTLSPPGGDAPLNVFFQNQSSGATDYEWLIDGEPISTSENISYTFADSGTYEVALAAWFDNPACADTAFYNLRVDPGMQVLLPNVVTPNGDGRNDNFVATIKWLEKAQWAIYNRWGREVHRDAADGLAGVENLTLWDIPNGTEPGSYSIVVSATGLNGNTRNFGVDFIVLE